MSGVPEQPPLLDFVLQLFPKPSDATADIKKDD